MALHTSWDPLRRNATVKAWCPSSRHWHWNVWKSPKLPHLSLKQLNGVPKPLFRSISSCCKNKLSDRAFFLWASRHFHLETMNLSSPSPSPAFPCLALSASLSLLQLQPSTQDLREMCRLPLLGNTTVLLKLQMEAEQPAIGWPLNREGLLQRCRTTWVHTGSLVK